MEVSESSESLDEDGDGEEDLLEALTQSQRSEDSEGMESTRYVMSWGCVNVDVGLDCVADDEMGN